MGFKPLQIKSQPNSKFTNSMMPTQGLNLEDLAQTMNVKFALSVVNYIPYRFGLEKRKGITKLFERAGANPVTLLREYRNNVMIVGYSNKLEAYDEGTNTWTTIKDDFAAGANFDGVRYGDYFFTTDGQEKPGRISMTLGYDSQSSNFTVGEKITGGTSGATAIILEDSDAGTSGTLTLGSISGTFQDNEDLTGSQGGDGQVNGTISFTYTTVTNAPICGGLAVIGSRLMAYRLKSDPTQAQYSEVDDTSNPPFDSWGTSTAISDGGTVSYRNAGPIRSVVQLGQVTVLFSDDGYFAYYINSIDSSGTLVKTEVIQDYTEDYGGARGAISTPYGIFYVNEAGLWQMVATGAKDQAANRQQVLTSELLGRKNFENLDQTNIDLFFSPKYKSVFITGAKDSSFNNFVLGYKLDLKAFYEFKNLNINRFAKKGNDIYIGSSVKTTIYKLFDGYDDDGLNIGTEMYQEIPLKALYHAHSLSLFYAGGYLSPSSEIKIAFDIYDIEGDFVPDKTSMTWTANEGSGAYDEYGSASFSSSAWGGGFSTAGLVQSFGGGSPVISNFQRLRVRITNGDKLPHILNWMAVKTEQKSPIVRRNISLNT